jgi:hypothetical protein
MRIGRIGVVSYPPPLALAVLAANKKQSCLLFLFVRVSFANDSWSA